jgi:hypothetical protein
MRDLYHFLTVAVAVALVSAAMCGSVYAQPTWELGVKAGINLAKLTGDVEESDQGTFDLGGGYYMVGSMTQAFDESKTGFVGGVYATVHINKQFGVRLEGLYSKKGGKGKNSGSLDVYDPSDAYVGSVDISGENTVTLDYFEIPLLAVVSFPVGSTATFDVFAGPALAFNTKAEVVFEMTLSGFGESETDKETVDIKDDIEGTDFGGVLGAGFTFPLSTVVLFGEARMTYGFKDVDKYEDSEIKNSVFGFIVGVGIPLAQSK